MADFTECRKYQRYDSTVCKVKVSSDNKNWCPVETCNISAGGLKFASGMLYDLNCHINLDICIYSMLSEFNFKCEGHILRKVSSKKMYYYAVRFDNVDKYVTVQLDELLKNNTNVRKNVGFNTHEDGSYTFLFFPRLKSRKVKMLR